VTEPTVVTLADPDACSLAAAERIIEILDVAIDDHDEAHWVTTGGSTPAAIYRHLAETSLRDELDWRKVHLWWTDDRFVPPDHPLSNAKIADEILLSPHRPGEAASGGVPIPLDQVHPFETNVAIGEGHDPDWCAHRYAEDLQADGPDPNDDGWPVFDLILLGIGPDGHILSVFPNSPAFDRREWALGVPAPTHVEPHVARVTLNPAIVPAAAELLVVSHGDGKAAILRDILRGERNVRALPAQLARRPGATWIVDREAARLL
jgi:6-phosphogluconolactonase